MKKILATIVAAFLMSAGLVALTSTTAHAGRCPDSGCTKTTTTASGVYQLPRGKSSRVKVRVAAAGNAKPTGQVVMVIRRQGTGKVRTKSYDFKGGVRVVNTGKLFKLGKYKVIVKYIPGPNDPFKRSRGVKLLQVR